LAIPPDIEPAIAGTMTVMGSWPPSDSVDAMWLFASEVYPLDSALVFSGIFAGKIRVYPSLDGTLPEGFDTLAFVFAVPPATYHYIGVLQRFLPGSDFNLDNYRVVGVYSNPGLPGEPRDVRVREYQVAAGINISIDFANPPPQPF
jgi:hypothetical protein